MKNVAPIYARYGYGRNAHFHLFAENNQSFFLMFHKFIYNLVSRTYFLIEFLLGTQFIWLIFDSRNAGSFALGHTNFITLEVLIAFVRLNSGVPGRTQKPGNSAVARDVRASIRSRLNAVVSFAGIG